MQYQLRVIRDGEHPLNIKLDAADQVDARVQAEKKGFTVLNIRASYNALLRRKNQFPLILFCQEFRVLIEAGLSINDVLETLIEKEPNANNKSTIQQLLTGISEGKTLSKAMADNAGAFPSLLVATVSAAESTGDLPEALTRYSQYLENIDVLKKRVVSASVYPAIVLGFGILVLLFLLAFVIPKFTRIYETQVKEISTSTEILLAVGNFSQQYGLFLLIGFVALLIFGTFLLTRASERTKIVALLWKLPYLGKKIRIYHLARFYRTFSMLIKSGIPVTNGLAMVQNLLGVGLHENLQQAKRLINEGKHFSDAFFTSNLTTPVAMRLFRVGEKTGTLAQMLERAATFHEEEMTRWIDHFTKIFEPTLMALIGVLIGGIVLMMYLPIFELASGLG
jgi:general secretion pathway protein F